MLAYEQRERSCNYNDFIGIFTSHSLPKLHFLAERGKNYSEKNFFYDLCLCERKFEFFLRCDVDGRLVEMGKEFFMHDCAADLDKDVN